MRRGFEAMGGRCVLTSEWRLKSASAFHLLYIGLRLLSSRTVMAGCLRKGHLTPKISSGNADRTGRAYCRDDLQSRWRLTEPEYRILRH
ncbi:hypothetical protein [Cupriavidus pauculus]|uniref:hypothetical protein n=1 Tax=Cupriavidus pauculus TaxID=82633 RepID=UPI003857D780